MHRIAIILLVTMLPAQVILSQPVVLVKYGESPETIKRDVRQYMDHLNIDENIHLTIRFTRQIPGDMWGITFCLDTHPSNDYRHIVIRIDSRLSPMRQRLVLAHEMIHVKQYAKGELIVLNKRQFIWKGKKYRTDIYSKQTPWEREAYKMDRLLAKKFRRKSKDHFTDLVANP